MKRRGVATWILVAVLAAPAWSELPAEPLEDLEIFYYSRLRYENLNNYNDLRDHSGTEGNDRTTFWAMRNQLGFGAAVAEGVRFRFEVQNLGTFGSIDPRRSEFDPAFQNVPNSGASAFGEERSDTSLYQAIVHLDEIGGSRVSVQAGRQEFVLATGLIMGSEPFYGGITLDGINGWYGGETWEAGGFFFKARERSDPGSQFFLSTSGSDDQDVAGAYGRFRFGGEEGRHQLDVYGIVRENRAESQLHARDRTFGGGWRRDVRTVAQAEANPMAWEVEAAWQTGTVDFLTDPNISGDVDLTSWILDGWFGWNFTAGRVLHMPFGGVFMIPGEDDLNGDDVRLFRPLFGTQHGRAGETDFFAFELVGIGLGINAYNAGYRITSDGGRHTGELSAWKVESAEDQVMFAGGTLELGEIGTEVDLLYDYAYRENVHLFVTYAHLSPADDLVDLLDMLSMGQTGDDPVTRIYGGFRLYSR